MGLLQTHNCMKKIWIKRFTSLALSLVLLTNSLTPYVLAQEITPSPEPTPTAETTPTPEPTLTATPTPEITPTPTLEVTPEVTPTPLPDTNPVDPDLSTTPSDPIPSPAPSIDLDSPDAQGSAQLTPSLSTDKDDYAPTETVIISGSDYQPNTTYTLVISSQDEPTVRYETTITSTEDGSIYYAYQLDGIYRPNYLIEVFLGSSLVKSITFTDSQDKVVICHASSSHTNPYQKNDPNKSAVVQGHDGHNGHNGPVWFSGITVSWGDIIPPFDYGDGQHYEGKNWTTEGQAIYNNNCEIPGSVQPPSESDFNLTSMCKPDENTGRLRVRNNSGSEQSFTIKWNGHTPNPYISGNAPIGDSFYDVPWTNSGDTWILSIAGFTYTKAIGNNPLCEPEPVCEPGSSWAHSVVDYDQGTLKSGGQITDPIRTDPSKTLGAAVSGDDSDFFSLGKDGWITLAFEYPVMDVDGTDLSFHETTWGNRDNYGEEKAKIEVAQTTDGPWVEIGTASSLDNDGEVGLKLLDFGFTGWSWVKYVRLTDTTDYSLHNNQGDGYDLDAVDATYQICDELDPEPLIPSYQCSQTIYAANNLTGFYDVNPTNGVLTNIATLTKGSSASADDPFNDRTYYVERYGDNLYYFQHSDSSNHLVGSTGIGSSSPVTKLAFNVYGQLFGLTDTHQLYRIDIDTGASTPLGTVSGIDTGGDIVFDETNTLYLISTDGNLYTVSLPGLTPTLIKNTGVSPITGLAYLDNQLYFSSTNAVYRIDKDGNNQVQLSSRQPQINDLSSCVPGQQATGRLQGTKYYDSNGNGIHDINAGETNYLNGWTIRLYDENWKYIDETVTSNLGNKGQYRFDVAPGTYHVCEVLQDDWTQTGPVLGAQSIDNNHNPTGNGVAVKNQSSADDEAGVCWQAELQSDELDGWLKFGNAQYSDVTVCKVNEANDPLSGWNVGILGSKVDTYTVPVNNTSVSTADLPAGDYALLAHGTYRFANWGDAGIADAGYSLRIPGQSYSAHTNPYDTWVSGDELNTPGALEIQVNGNNVDWGLFSDAHEYLYSLSSHPGGPLSFRIYDNVISDNLNSVTNPLSVSVHHGFTGITSEDGCTTFKDVPYGDYTLYESLQAGWVNNTGHNTQVTVDSSTEKFTLINLANKSISGFKYEDTGTGTKILSDWAIYLFSCAALGDCSPEPIITTTTTVNGYDFQNLTSGYYLVKEDAREGWSPKQSLSWFVDLVNQQSVQVDFTNARNSSITACKVEDSDGDLSTDNDRTIVTGWPISLYQNGQFESKQYTGNNGCYTWTDLDPYQSYKIYEEIGDSGSIALTNPEYTFSSLTPNQDHQHTFVNFRMGMVRGYKYHDINADGMQASPNGEEGPLNDWEICLVPHQQTDDQEISLLSASESISEVPNCVLTGAGEWSDGYYEFTHLGPGTYRLYETPQSGWTQTQPSDLNGYVFTVNSGFGIGGGWYNFGNTGSPNLSLTKTNDYKGQVVSAGTKVTYTLVVSNTGDGLASNVEIVDAPPTYGYFEYGADTGQVSCSEGTTQSLSAAGTNPYIWTMPVNLLPGQSCTLNYTTTINDSDKIPGTHGNIAFARALGHDKQTYFSDPVIDPFTVGSDSDFSGGVGGGEESGDVLGASTTTGQVLGASTGTPSLWSLLGLLFIALGLALRLPKNSLKKLIPAIFLIISPFVILPSAYAQTESSDTTPPSVSIVKLPPYKNTNSFEISYTALDASQDGLKDVVLRFRREGGSWQDLATYTSTAAKFLLNSSHIIQDDRYYFQAYACDHAGNCASDETSTIVDRELPPAPESFQKAWKDEYAYILKWHNPSSTQSYKVYIYRYHEPVFIAQDASLIAVLDVTPNTDIEWQNSHPEPKPYYYAIRNVDPAGNTSGLVSDPETTATTTSSQSAPEGTPVTDSESFSGTKLVAAQSGSGQILGEQDSQDEDQNEEGSEVSPDSDAINQALDQATPEDDQDSSSSIPWRILIIVAVGIILIYIFYIRKK